MDLRGHLSAARRLTLCIAIASGFGCGEDSVGLGSSASGESTGSSSTASTGTQSSTDDGGSSTTDTAGPEPICQSPPLGDDPVCECDIWAQDCPDGYKCMPYADDGGNAWNAVKCSPIDADPNEPGQACSVVESGVSGVDDCAARAMCWDVDPETSLGVCVSFCVGSQLEPACEDPNTACVINNDGVLILCLPTCNPLVQDCPEGVGQACYFHEENFVCLPDASGPDGPTWGDPCEFQQSCDPGLYCAPAAWFSNCPSTGCCTLYCDMNDADPGCVDDAQVCIALFEPGEAPDGHDHVGACGVP